MSDEKPVDRPVIDPLLVVKFVRFGYAPDTSGTAVRLFFEGEEKKSATVEMSLDALRPLISRLINLDALLTVDRAIGATPNPDEIPPLDSPNSETPPTVSFVTQLEGAIHPDSGAISMRFRDSTGQVHQVTLSPNMTDMLRTQLTKSNPTIQ